MNTEEKAQAYDKVLEKSKEFYILCKKCGAKDTVDFLEDSFPELKESEDEKVRKAIIAIISNYVDNSNTFKPKMLDWLEKQGKIVDYYEDRLDECACKYFNKGYKHALEKQGEQKPTCGDDKKLTDVNHEYFSELLENNDSKDINDYAYQVAYCMSHDWIEETATWDDVQKACKLGAEWNEKRHKSAWSKDDEEHVNSLLKRLEGLCRKEFSTTRFAINEDEDWLKSLKNRVPPKQEWNKEDDGMLDTMEGWLDTLCEYLKDSSSEYIPDVESCINWLKSLKQKIGG